MRVIILDMSIVGWMRRNAALFRHAGTALAYNKNLTRLLLAGPFAAALSPFFDKFAPDASVDVYQGKEFDEADFPFGENDTVSSLEKERYDFIAAPLYIMYLSPSSLASFLWDCHDALSDNGILYLSFSDAIASNPGMTDYPSWYSDKMLKLKFYPLADMLSSLEAVGFMIKDIQIDHCDVFDRVVTLILVKNLK